jgi:hypothetical protein
MFTVILTKAELDEFLELAVNSGKAAVANKLIEARDNGISNLENKIAKLEEELSKLKAIDESIR